MSTKQRSADDLRAIFAADASDVPDDAAQRIWAEVDTPVHVVRTHPARVRRWAVPLAAAAVVAAVAVPLAVVRVLPHHSATNSGTSPSLRRADLAYTFDVTPVAGLTFAFGDIVPTSQGAAISRNGVDVMGSVIVNARGAFDPTVVANAEPVSVNGHRGYYGLTYAGGAEKADEGTSVVVQPARDPTVAWEIAPDRWATVFLPEHAAANVRATLLQIATAVRLTAPRPLHLPFRTDWLPRNAPAMSEAESWFTSQQDWGGIQRFGDTAHHRGLEILESRSGNPGFQPNTTAAGHPAQFFPARDVNRPARPSYPPASSTPMHLPANLTVSLGGDAWLTLTGDYSEADLIRIVEHLSLTPTPDDHSAWFDATQ